MEKTFRVAALLVPALASGAVPLDLSGVRPGPVTVALEGDAAVVRWRDEAQRAWEARFNLEPARPLIASIGVEGKTVVQNAVPIYNGQTGKTRGL
jgi:hypothetical protein